MLYQLRRALTEPVPGADGAYRSLADIGISTARWDSGEPAGTIVLDRAKLAKALAADSVAVACLFGAVKPNVATGAAVTASSELDANHPATGVVDGDSSSTRWGSGTGWANAITNSFDDPETDALAESGIWVKIEFKDDAGNTVQHTIDQLNIHTLDSSTHPAAQYGIRDYDLQWGRRIVADSRTGAGQYCRRAQPLFDPVSTTAVRSRSTPIQRQRNCGTISRGSPDRSVRQEQRRRRLEDYLRPQTRAVTGAIDRRLESSRLQMRIWSGAWRTWSGGWSSASKPTGDSSWPWRRRWAR